jgi:glycosyltransferase involved in cell wall biosynthesis
VNGEVSAVPEGTHCVAGSGEPMTPSITVVTVTFNAAKLLPGLIESLRAQTDRDFEWVVVDGVSTDGTVEMLKSAGDIVSKWISEPDCGIYDAMNKAVCMSEGDYYLVCGADDRLSADAIGNYRKCLAQQAECDMIVAGVRVGDACLLGYRPKKRWLGHTAMFTQHSVGTLIRRKLHEIHGDYDLRFSVLADGYFLKRAAIEPGIRIVSADFIAGEFSPGGASGAFLARTLCELWSIQLLTEPSPLLQTGIHLLRIIRHYGRIVDGMNRFKTKQLASSQVT